MSAMTKFAAPLLRALPTMLFCLTVAGAAEATAPIGSVVGWGDDYVGEATPPNAVNGIWGTATDIAAGRGHSCAIQAGTGNVVCWGYNGWGQATVPDAVNGISGTATGIAAGHYYSCAIQSDTGAVVCWGHPFREDYGQTRPPDAVNGISGTATDIAAGYLHSCAIQAGTGNVVCWGRNSFGESTPPDAVNGVSGTATHIAAGSWHSCAIQASTGNVVCWGNGYLDQLAPPDAVNGVSGTATDISVGNGNNCAIQAGSGSSVCWGYYDLPGQAPPPDDVNGISGTATDITLGTSHGCAVQAVTGNVVCWGYDYYGQAMPPDAVNGVSGTASRIAAGNYHTLAIVGPPEPIRFTKPQRACVIAMNKSGEKVNRVQLKENERCLKSFQVEKLVAPMAFDDCTTADGSGRVRRAGGWTAMRDRMTCDSLDVPPPFAYTDSATVNTAALDGALALTYKIFGGPPVLAADLVTMADSKDTARCQFVMLKRANQLENTILKEINKAKRRALRDETVDSEAAFESKLQAVLSSNDKINEAQDRLEKQVDNECADLQAPLDAIFAGGCGQGDTNLSEVEACVITAARCEACLQINAFDDLNLDCDQADDQTFNGSCL
jgi:alpha-tubulin suppressor-like RCC1 family protein